MAEEVRPVKCLIWDLDNTLWEGTLSEGGGARLRPGVAQLLRELDRRGILLSVASRNEAAPALERLRALGVEDYFLCPQISWGEKPAAVQRILELLNLKPEAVALIDDNPFERDAVRYRCPRVRVYAETAVDELLSLPEFSPRFITPDSANRRRMYQNDLRRRQARTEFTGPDDAFLRTLDIHISVKPVTEADLQRVEELTVRTHQLNSTGYTYSYEELAEMARSPRYIFRICSMRDRYGDNGKVGLLLLERTGEQALTLKLLIVSCRVMAYGIGSALLAYAIRRAVDAGELLLAEFLQTEHNRIMYITYKFAGFEELREDGDRLLLYFPGDTAPALPDYITWDAEDAT